MLHDVHLQECCIPRMFDAVLFKGANDNCVKCLLLVMPPKRPVESQELALETDLPGEDFKGVIWHNGKKEICLLNCFMLNVDRMRRLNSSLFMLNVECP